MEHHKTALPTCPHCDHEYTYDEMNECSTANLWALALDEGMAVLQCPICDLEFWVQGGYRPEYTTAYAEEQF
jgi:transcription elongation factor Elf1